MTTRNVEAVVPASPTSGKKYFTLQQANQSLPYIRRVVTDLTACYAHVLEIRHDIEHPQPDQTPEHLEAAYEKAMERLGLFVDELNLVGVELKDFEKGLLDFPSLLEDREILLCWQLGEDQILAWHEVEAGYKGRQDVELLASKA
jgi:hypothetical protein